jgi:hypothetical protein
MITSKGISSKGYIKKELKKPKKTQDQRKEVKSHNFKDYYFQIHDISSFHFWTRYIREGGYYKFDQEVPVYIQRLPEYKQGLKAYNNHLKNLRIQESQVKLKEALKAQHTKSSFHKSLERSYPFNIRPKPAGEAEFESIEVTY